MTLKKVTTYVDEDLLRSVKVLAAKTDSRVYEVLDEALRKHLGLLESEVADDRAYSYRAIRQGESLAEALSRSQILHEPLGMRPGEEGSVSLREGETLSGAVVSERAERESRRY